MNFFSHKIANPVGTSQSWNDWLAQYLKKNASEAKPECDGDPRGQCRGQVINNDNEEGAHSYQEGESVDGKKDQAESGSHKPNNTEPKSSKKAHCAKDMGECSKAGDVTEEHSDAENADVGEAQVSQKINNDPNYQKGESTGKAKSEKSDGQKSKSDKSDKKSDKKASVKKGFEKIASLNRKGKLELFAYMTAQKNKSGSPAYPIQYIEAMVGLTFANMKDDEKEWFRKFWKTQYPDSYVEEMVADR